MPRSAELGRLVARIAGLHQMSMAVAGALERHDPADVPAAVVKVLGTTTEGDIADFADLSPAASTRDPGFVELSRPRSISARASPCAAGPTRCCAA